MAKGSSSTQTPKPVRRWCVIKDCANKQRKFQLRDVSQADLLIELARECSGIVAASRIPDSKNFPSQIRGQHTSKNRFRTVSGLFVLRLCVIANIPISAIDDVVTLPDRNDYEKALTTLSECDWGEERPEPSIENLLARLNAESWDSLIARCKERVHKRDRKYFVGAGLSTSNAEQDQSPFGFARQLRGLILNRGLAADTPLTLKSLAKIDDDQARNVLKNRMTEEDLFPVLQIVEQHYGLLAYDSKTGEFRVRQFTRDELDEIVDLRQMLECYLVTQAAIADQKDELLERLTQIHAEMEKCLADEVIHGYGNMGTAGTKFVQLDMEFHLEFTRRRPITLNSLKYLLGILQAQRVHFLAVDVDRMQTVIREHGEILGELKKSTHRPEPLRHVVAVHIRAAQSRDDRSSTPNNNLEGAS